MIIYVNGSRREAEPSAPLLNVLDETALEADRSAPRRGVAIAVNGDVVSRGEISSTRLSEGDRIEIVTAVQGG